MRAVCMPAYTPTYASLATDRREYELFRDMLAEAYLTTPFDLLLAGIQNAALSERGVKRAGRARVLDLRGFVEHESEYSAALNGRAIQQLRGARKELLQAVAEMDADPDQCERLDGIVEENSFRKRIEHEIIPDARQMLLDAPATPAEAALLWKGLGDSRAYTKPVRETLRQAAEDLTELIDARGSEGRGQEVGEEGVPRWKVIATRIITAIIRVAIIVCIATTVIICLVLRILWRMVETKVVEEVYGWCRDTEVES